MYRHVSDVIRLKTNLLHTGHHTSANTEQGFPWLVQMKESNHLITHNLFPLSPNLAQVHVPGVFPQAWLLFTLSACVCVCVCDSTRTCPWDPAVLGNLLQIGL